MTCHVYPSNRVVISLAVIAITGAFLAFPGCQTSKPSGAPETLDDLYQYRETYRDSIITLTGNFMGWQGSTCTFPPYAAPQESRSDWIFRIGDKCVYVTGGIPPAVSPMEGVGVGIQIRLDARLRITPGSQLLLEYVRSAQVSK